MQYIFNVVTGRIVVSTLAAFLLKNENRYIEVDLNNPNETNKAAEARAAEMGVELSNKPVDVWLEYIDYINTLTVVSGDPLYNYLKSAGMDLPTVIELDRPNQEQSTAVAEITMTVTVTDMVGNDQETAATVIAGKITDATMKIFSETDPVVKPAVVESPTVTTDVVSQSATNPEAPNDPVPLSGSGTYEEVLDALAKNGYFIDNADGELDKVSKDLYGFKHNDRVVVLAPKATAVGDDYILLQSITLVRQVVDGVMKLEPTYGASFGVACGTPVVTELNEDVVNLHNKLLQTVGYTGQGNLVIRQSPDGSLVTMAGHLVSLTQSQ